MGRDCSLFVFHPRGNFQHFLDRLYHFERMSYVDCCDRTTKETAVMPVPKLIETIKALPDLSEDNGPTRIKCARAYRQMAIHLLLTCPQDATACIAEEEVDIGFFSK